VAMSVSAKLDTVGLTLCGPLARRFGQAIDMQGAMTADVRCVWEPTGRVALEARSLHVESLDVTAPDFLGADQLRMRSLDVRGHCAIDRGVWTIRGARLECDAGHLTAEGQFRWQPGSDEPLWRTMLASIGSADLVLDGTLDLAALARTLPRTLRVREGAEIESGTVQFELAGQHGTGRRQFQASVETSNLAAVREGQRFAWNDPLRANVEAEEADGSWSVRRLICEAPFLTLTGAGKLDQGLLDFQCDLDRLMEELHQFVDLGELRASGVLTARLNWDTAEQGFLSARGTGSIQDVQLTHGTMRWSEPQLSATLAVECDLAGERLSRIRAARLELVSATDRLDLKLLEGVTDPSRDSVWSLACRASGEWSSWLERLRPMLPAGGWEASGPLELEITAQVSALAADVQQAVIRCEPFRLRGDALRIEEPAIAIEGNGRWDWGTGRGSVTQGTFQSAALAFRVSDVSLAVDDQGTRLTGDLSFRSDLARWSSSWRIPGLPEDWRFGGSAQGQLSLVQGEGLTKARWSLDVAGAELARRADSPASPGVVPASQSGPWRTIWSEPQLKCLGSGSYDAAADTVVLDRLEVSAAEAVRIAAEGTIGQPLDRCLVDVKGRATYDLAQVMERLQPLLPVRVVVTGSDTQSFWLRGPLRQAAGEGTVAAPGTSVLPPGNREMMVPAELAGQADLRWRSADLFGIGLGPGQLSARLDTGVVHTGLVEARLSRGTLRISPRLHLVSPSPWVTVDRGQILEDVAISPAMCEQWLKYVAPLAAEATRAEGQFSLTVDQVAIPLLQPGAARAQGVLAIRSAQLGPGPLAVQLIYLAEQAKAVVQRRLPGASSLAQGAWVRIPQQETRFHLSDGRVYHDRLELQMGDMVLQTRGSVGFDQSLALVAQIPIRDEWVAGDPRLARLSGQTVEVPISGTFRSPRLDRQAMEKLSAQVIQQAAGRILEDELNKGLRQLFGPGR
jgi:translocation and assembly module TamB